MKTFISGVLTPALNRFSQSSLAFMLGIVVMHAAVVAAAAHDEKSH